MARTVGRTLGGPLLILNFIMYVIVLGLAGWALSKFINMEAHPYLAGNTATMYFIIFSLIAGTVGVASTFSGSYHLRAWRTDSLAAAASSALIAWVLTALASGMVLRKRLESEWQLETVLDLSAICQARLFNGPLLKSSHYFLEGTLNAFMAMGRPAWKEAKATIQKLYQKKD